jgi:hypothetical protein
LELVVKIYWVFLQIKPMERQSLYVCDAEFNSYFS